MIRYIGKNFIVAAVVFSGLLLVSCKKADIPETVSVPEPEPTPNFLVVDINGPHRVIGGHRVLLQALVDTNLESY